ncbi:MAG: L-threonylcarbamoyladenylate synthase [Actinomycetota bacterium]|nr:L-threonylcarbamoyladenylate synthase [Actinomycetota bacterium]
MTDLQSAVQALQDGEVVVVPTDTVYGLACLPARPDAVAKIFELKGRSQTKALPVLGASLSDLTDVAQFDLVARSLAEEFWPGPLTLVLSRASAFDHDLGGSDPKTVAVRIPESKITAELMTLVGPLAVTSANLSGEDPVAGVEQARALFGDRVSSYLDEGTCDSSPSTVVSLLEGLRVLRAGAISEERLRQAVTP